MNKSAILLTSIDTFYNIPENRATLLEILNKTGGISLRETLNGLLQIIQRKTIYRIRQTMVKYLVYTCAYKSSLDGTVKNFLTHFVVRLKYRTLFRVHPMKYIRLLHS